MAPAGAIDCHVHLFGPASRWPFHSASKYVSQDALPETYVALQDTLGLSGAVIVSGGGYGPDTRHLEEVLARWPDRFRGVALLPEGVNREHLQRLHGLGVRGVRFSSPGHGGAIPHLSRAVIDRIAEFGWHTQFYPAGDDLLQFADELMALPTPVVLDHFASIPAEGGTSQPAFRKLLALLDTGRVWVKLSAPMRLTRQEFPYAPVTPLARALVKHAPHRLLWATDWPHVNFNGRPMPNDGDLFDLLGEWVQDEAVRRQVLVENPREVYGFAAV